MIQQENLSYFSYEGCLYFINNYLDTPPVGVALFVIVFMLALYYSLKESPQQASKRDKFEAAISAFSSKQRLLESFNNKKYEDSYKQAETPNFDEPGLAKPIPKAKAKSQIKQKVKEKYFKPTKRSMIYKTLDEQREEQAQKERQIEQLKAQQRRKQMEEQKIKQQKARELKDKQLKEKELRANEEKKKVQFKDEAINELDESAQQPSQKSVRSGERKTTIQLVVDENQKKQKQEQKPQPSKTFSLFENQTTNKIGSLANPPETAPAINNQFGNLQSTGLFAGSSQSISNPITSIKMPNFDISPPSVPRQNAGNIQSTSLFQNVAQNTAPPKQQQKKEPPSNAPSGNQGLQNAERPSRPAGPVRQQVTLSSGQYFEELMKFAQSQNATVQISTLMANLGGAKSSLNDLLTFAQSFIDTITKTDDSQLTAFSVKIYEGIVRQISTSNLKDGIYRIPPKSKTDQVQKNSINCYILYINLYRLMGFQKVWTIVFGKLLRLLQFIYKRTTDLKDYNELELLANKHVEKRGELEGKYLSRIDYLTYLLIGLTAYDPIMVFRQTEQKDPNVRESRERIEAWGREWNYKEFWMLTDLFLKNKHYSYFKPIVYMNILSALYPRIYANKQNPQHFKAENQLYKLIIEEGKKYFAQFKTIPELKNLKKSDEGNGFEYDGDNFVQDIKVLESRLTVQKVKEFNVRLGDNNANARDFESKSNVFYYFSKEK